MKINGQRNWSVRFTEHYKGGTVKDSLWHVGPLGASVEHGLKGMTGLPPPAWVTGHMGGGAQQRQAAGLTGLGVLPWRPVLGTITLGPDLKLRLPISSQFPSLLGKK